MKASILLLLLSSVILLKADDVARPKPAAMVTDTAGTLSTEALNNLEYLLVGRKDEQNCELYVFIEQSPDLSPEEYKTQLRNSGNQWSRNDWAILAHDPRKNEPPVIVAGGSFLDGDGENAWEEKVALIQDLSTRNWSKEIDIEAFAHRISDLLVFLSRQPHAESRAIARKEKLDREAAQKARKKHQNQLMSIAAMGVVAFVFLWLLIWKISSTTKKRRFPETQWSQRLEAPHSGGSSLNHKFPPVQF